VFCRSCGRAIKAEAEVCPHCGVRNAAQSPQQQSTGTTQSKPAHDPSQYETTVSENWYYGIVAGAGIWMFSLLLAGLAPNNEGGIFVGLLVLAAIIGLPIATYFDIRYVRANSKWNPNTVAWIIGTIVWFVNIPVALVYLYRRHETLGQP
jgi:hypothetical protein